MLTKMIIEICKSESKARGLIKLYQVRLLAMGLVSIIDKNKETYCMQQNKNITLNTFLCSLLLNQNLQINLIYIHPKKYILFSLVIGPLIVTRLFLSMDHKHNIEKYTFIHVVMFTL
jgi:hypothetical protein